MRPVAQARLSPARCELRQRARRNGVHPTGPASSGGVIHPAPCAHTGRHPGERCERRGRCPVSFELNEGQVAAPVSFLARAGGEMLFLTPNEAYLEAIQLPPSVAALSTTSGLLAPRAVRRAHRAAPAPAPP